MIAKTIQDGKKVESVLKSYTFEEVLPHAVAYLRGMN